MDAVITPSPRSVRKSKTELDLSEATWILVPSRTSHRLKRHVVDFAAAVSGAFRAPLQVTAGAPEAGGVLLTIQLTKDAMPAQGYELKANTTGVSLTAPDEAGVFYGLQTLAQIIEQLGARFRGFTIKDHPDFDQRGVMLDVSRCKVPTMETMRQLVGLCARLKFNQLQLYTEHTFAFSAHEVVWHDASPFTPEEILELDACCADHFIQLVPNFNSFGHWGRWLQHPEYKHLAECPDGYEKPRKSSHGSVLAPNDQSLHMLDSLYAELLPNFTSPLFNVGCDETWELGQGWSKKLCEKKGTTRVYLDFLLQIDKLVRRYGRQMMFWGDIILHEPDLIKELPEDVVALDWGYGAQHPYNKECKHFAGSGVPFYVCPGTSSWNSLTGRTQNCLGNLENAAKNGMKHGAMGYLITDWGDGGHHQYLPISYTGFVAGAGYSWCYRANKDMDVPEAMNRMIFDDPTGLTGSLFYELGKVLEILPGRTGNSSIFGRLLFWNMTDPMPEVEGMTPKRLRKCIEAFDGIEAQAAEARPQTADAALLEAELRNAINMARHAARRALAVIDKKMDRTQLRHELQHIIGEHERLWLARNRPGGLHESSGRLRRALEPLR